MCHDRGCVRNTILSYYSTVSVASSMYVAHIVCTFSVCMKYPDDLLYLPESKLKYPEISTEAVFRMAYYHTTHTILQYAVWILWIVCAFSIFMECPDYLLHLLKFDVCIWRHCMGCCFPECNAPCDVSSSNVWVNWRRGIVIINVTLVV